VRTDIAKSNGLRHIPEQKAYQLPREERLKRISALFDGMAHLEGGAKQTLHYTDVSPVVTIMAITKGGNHIFGHAIRANSRGLPEVELDALKETLSIFSDDLLSEVYVGWIQGYLDDERAKIERLAVGEENKPKQNETSEVSSSEPNFKIRLSHPRKAFQDLIAEMNTPENASWLD
jgi:CRISPR-associated protein Cst2